MIKVCVNCETENPSDAVLCSDCGMSLRRAPTGAEAAKIKEEIEAQFQQRRRELAEHWRSRAEEPPSASGIVYLFGDRFAPDRGKGEELTWRGVRVDGKHLANQLLLSAFVHLAGMGCIRIEQVEYKRLGILTTRDIGVVRLAGPSKPLHGLEAAIWENISDNPRENRVTKIIGRIIETESEGPWWFIVGKAKEGLREQGYLVRQVVMELPAVLWSPPERVQWFADEEWIASHEGKAEEVKAMLASFEADDPQLYKQLGESVRKGMESMEYDPAMDHRFDW